MIVAKPFRRHKSQYRNYRHVHIKHISTVIDFLPYALLMREPPHNKVVYDLQENSLTLGALIKSYSFPKIHKKLYFIAVKLTFK